MKKIIHSQRPLILITNDDGIQARGLQQVAQFLKPLGDIVVVAPDGPRSGQSSAITVTEPLRMKVIDEQEGFCQISTNGTPVDCIKLSMNILFDRRPDLIVSGINHGSNSGVSVVYSGTMGAVFEGALLHIPSIGFSLCNHKADADFAPCRDLVVDICRKALAAKQWPQGIGLNVNIPNRPQLNGVKLCRASQGYWTEEYDCRVDPHGREYFWLTGTFKNNEPDATDTDEYWLDRGYATIVPCSTDCSAIGTVPEFASILNL